MQKTLIAGLVGVAMATVGVAYPLRHGARSHDGHHRHRRHAHEAGAVTAERLAERAQGRDPSSDVGEATIRGWETRTLVRRPLQRGRARECHDLTEPDLHGRWISQDDLAPRLGAVSGDDLLALVNRSPGFALDPRWAPDDLVDLATGEPMSSDECEGSEILCLRRGAAEALGRMLAGMSAAGVPGYVHSAYRSFRRQCAVFRKWAYVQGEGFCGAVRSSALAGHSQHQLGTTVDLFTAAWAHDRVSMRPDFGCTPGGVWLAAHSWEYGFVLSYPLPVDGRDDTSVCASRADADIGIDPRTGYTYEPWHLRYIGTDAAADFHRAVVASGVGTGGEISLEQWLRRRHGIPGDADLPTCDGCTCGLCATFHHRHAGGHEARGPCDGDALLLGDDGQPVGTTEAPRVVSVTAVEVPEGVRVEAVLDVPPGTVTQTPAVTAEGPRYTVGAWPWTLSARDGGPEHRYPDLPRAWRLCAEPTDADDWPWRAALRSDASAVRMDGANLWLPATAGRVRVVMLVPAVPALRVALVREGVTTGTTTVRVLR